MQAWLNVIDAVGSLLSGLGLIAAAIGVWLLKRQTVASERAAEVAVFQSIVALGTSINDMNIERPDLHKELFQPGSDKRKYDVYQDQFDAPERFFTATKWLDYFESVLAVWAHLPKELHEPWRIYMLRQFHDSPYLRSMVLETDWYGEDLRTLCREAQTITAARPAMAQE